MNKIYYQIRPKEKKETGWGIDQNLINYKSKLN